MSAPPRAAEELIRRSVRRPTVARTILGDLHEEHAELRARRTAAWAVAWYWLQALRIAAHYRFGRPTRQRRWRRWGDDLRLDVRYALRGMRRSPGLGLVIVATLALAIGVNATMFGVVDRLLLSAPPHIRNPRAVVRLQLEMTGPGGDPFVQRATSYATYRDLLGSTEAFEGWAATASREAVLGSGESAGAVAASAVSGNYFELLGPDPELGRFLNPADDREPAGSAAIVISHGLWQRRFGGTPSILGSEVLVDGAARAIVGVAPPGFHGDGLAPIELWMPINAAFAEEDPSWRHDRRRRTVSVIGRVEAETNRATARDEVDRALRRGTASTTGLSGAPRAMLAPLVAGRGPAGMSMEARISVWLSGVTAIVLAVALANVVNLLLLRGEQRRLELALRRALGMGRARLLRHALTEALLLAGAGGIGALLVAAWTAGVVRSWLLPEMAVPATALSTGEVTAVGAATLVAALITGALPVLQGSFDARETVHGAWSNETRYRSRMRNGLLIAQTAMSMVLLVGAGLFVASLRNVQAQDLGMHLDGVLVAEIRFGGDLPARQHDQLYREALARVRRLPGVARAVAAQTLPFGSFMTVPMGFPGKDFRALFGERQLPYFHAVEPGFFELMGIDIVAGRGLRATDGASAPPVTVISESLARYVWGGGPPVGECMRAGMIDMPTPESFLDGAGEDVPCYEIVGVAADVEERSLVPEERLSMQWYTTFDQMPPLPPMMSAGPQVQALLIAAPSRTDEVAVAVRRTMQGASDQIAYVDVRRYRELIDPNARGWRLGATLFSAFGVLALVIAAVGMYGVFGHVVTQRTREMGIRMALGARRLEVARLILGASLRTVAVGVLGGVVIALWSARHIEELLYETDAHDPAVFGAVVLILCAVALAASLLPALRATRTDPKDALQQG